MINLFGEEEFKPIIQRGKILPYYLISNDGRIYSIRSNKFKKTTVRTRPKRSGKGNYVMDVSTSIPIPRDLFEDYEYRTYGNQLTNKSTVEFPMRIHKAVMETWRPIDEYPPDRLKDDWDNAPESFKQWVRETAYIDHIDDDPTNNNLDNLRWVTPRENANWVKRKYDIERDEKMKNENWEEEGREKRRKQRKDHYHRIKKFKPQTEKEKARKRRWYEKTKMDKSN